MPLLDACIAACSHLSTSTRVSHPPDPHCQGDAQSLYLFGKALCSRGVALGRLSEIDEGLEALHTALTSPWSSYQSDALLSDIAAALHPRWDLAGVLDDLSASIKLRRVLLAHCDPCAPSRIDHVRDLSTALFLRFTHFPRLGDLHEAIALNEQALSLSTSLDDDAGRFEDMCTFAQTLLVRWDYDGDMSGIEQAISLLRQAVAVAPSLAQPLDHALILNALSEAMQGLLFLSKDDLDHCIALDQRALTLVPSDHPERALTLAAMATTTLVRFTLEKRKKDWECYKDMHLELASIVATCEATCKSIPFIDESSWAFFQHVGQYAKRHALASVFRQAKYTLRAKQDWTRALPVHRRKLGPNVFLRRLQDPIGPLQQHLVYARVRMRAVPDASDDERLLGHHIACVAWLCRSKTIPDLENKVLYVPKSIEAARSYWLDNALQDHPWLYAYHGGLGNDLYDINYHHLDNNDDDKAAEALLEAAKSYKKAMELQLVIDHPLAYQSMSNIANAYVTMGKRIPGTPRELIDDAVKYSAMAVSSCPEGYPNEVLTYADAYVVRYALWKDEADIDTAMTIFRRVYDYQMDSLSLWYEVADRWADVAREYQHSCRLEAYSMRIKILISTVFERFNMAYLTQGMHSWGGPSAMASATEYCISQGELDEALRILGTGRGAMWARMLQLQQRNIQFLRASRPNEVAKLEMMLEAAEMERQIIDWSITTSF